MPLRACNRCSAMISGRTPASNAPGRWDATVSRYGVRRMARLRLPKIADSRFRGNDGWGRSGLRRADNHSCFRGNDDSKVIPAEAGIHTALTEDERTVAGTGGEIPCVTAGAGSLTVAGFRVNDGWGRSELHRADNHSRVRVNDVTGAYAVTPAKAGIHRPHLGPLEPPRPRLIRAAARTAPR